MRNSPYIRSAPPGSPAAIEGGCTCPVEDNNHGKGAHREGGLPHYIIAQDCRLHWPFAQKDV